MLAALSIRPLPTYQPPLNSTLPPEPGAPAGAFNGTANFTGFEPFLNPLPINGSASWDTGTFAGEAKNKASEAHSRVARGSLRPVPEILSTRWRLGGSTVGATLRSYATMRWNEQQRKVPVSDITKEIQQHSVRLLGGSRTEQGAEFKRRCLRIDKTTVQLDRIKNQMLELFQTSEWPIVNEVIGALVVDSMTNMENGYSFDPKAKEKAQKAIECAIADKVPPCGIFRWVCNVFRGC